MKEQTLPTINKNLCTLCGACVTGCPEEALVMEEQGPTYLHPENAPIAPYVRKPAPPALSGRVDCSLVSGPVNFYSEILRRVI